MSPIATRLFSGLTLVLIDEETIGGAEALASAIRSLNKVLAIGAPNCRWRGRIRRFALAKRQNFPGRDGRDRRRRRPIDLSEWSEAGFAGRTGDGGQAADFPDEHGQRHGPVCARCRSVRILMKRRFSRAQIRNWNQPSNDARAIADHFPRDAVLQRALDVITSLEVYQKR